jgi:hypothetical protein
MAVAARKDESPDSRPFCYASAVPARLIPFDADCAQSFGVVIAAVASLVDRAEAASPTS